MPDRVPAAQKGRRFGYKIAAVAAAFGTVDLAGTTLAELLKVEID